jgi:hypothetical protein
MRFISLLVLTSFSLHLSGSSYQRPRKFPWKRWTPFSEVPIMLLVVQKWSTRTLLGTRAYQSIQKIRQSQRGGRCRRPQLTTVGRLWVSGLVVGRVRPKASIELQRLPCFNGTQTKHHEEKIDRNHVYFLWHRSSCAYFFSCLLFILPAFPKLRKFHCFFTKSNQTSHFHTR